MKSNQIRMMEAEATPEKTAVIFGSGNVDYLDENGQHIKQLENSKLKGLQDFLETYPEASVLLALSLSDGSTYRVTEAPQNLIDMLCSDDASDG